MQAIRLFMKVDSENIHVLELREFIGKKVEMIIMEEPNIFSEKKDRNMERFFSTAGKIEIDEEAVRQLREESKLGDITIPNIQITEPLKLECQHFINCVTNGKIPRSDGRDGLRVVRALQVAQKSLDKDGVPVGIH